MSTTTLKVPANELVRIPIFLSANKSYLLPLHPSATIGQLKEKFLARWNRINESDENARNRINEDNICFLAGKEGPELFEDDTLEDLGLPSENLKIWVKVKRRRSEPGSISGSERRSSSISSWISSVE